MIRRFLFLLLFLFSLFSVNGFDIYDEEGVSKSYFSLNSPLVQIQSDIQFNNYTVFYTLENVSRNEVVSFVSCNSRFCGNFSLLTLMDNTNDTFSGSKLFIVNVGAENRTIFLDFERPSFDLNSNSTDQQLKHIEFRFNYSDNSDLIEKLEILSEVGNTETLLSTLTGGEEAYNFTLNDTQNITVIFRTYDVAGNVQEVNRNYVVEDIFPPKINSVFISKDEGAFTLTLNVEDRDLNRYEVIQGNITISEDIDGESSESTISLPFTSGSFSLDVYDDEGNIESRNISLETSTLSMNFQLRYSNEKRIKVGSNANTCTLLKVDGDDINNVFTKADSSTFVYDLNINQVKDYDIEFFCETSSVREYFEENFYYDINPPSNVKLVLTQDDDGSIRTSWSKATDNEAPVSYRLVKDGEIIYSGTDLRYKDERVKFPNEYEYYVAVYDSSGNRRDSDTKKITPQKTQIDFLVNLFPDMTIDSSPFKVNFETEEGNIIRIIVRTETEIISDEILSNNDSTETSTEIELVEGLNIVEIEVKDIYGNLLVREFEIMYEPNVLTSKSTTSEVFNTQPVDVSELNSGNEEINLSSDVNGEENENEGGNFIPFWLWFLIWIIVLLVIGYGFFIRGTDIEKKVTAREHRRNIRDRMHGLFSPQRIKDSSLNRDVRRIKEQRIRRQRELERMRLKEKERETKQAKLSEMQKQKLKDLERKREVSIPVDTRSKSKKRVTRIKKEVGSKEEVEPKKERKGIFRSKGKEPDEMSKYLAKDEVKRGWNDIDGYYSKSVSKQIEEIREIEEKIKEDVSRETSGKKEVKEENITEKKSGFFSNLFGDKPEIKRDHMNDYLNKRKKKKKSLFVEREVDDDIRKRG